MYVGQNANHALILDRSRIINIETETLRRINGYLKKRYIESKIVSPPQLHVHGPTKFYLYLFQLNKITKFFSRAYRFSHMITEKKISLIVIFPDNKRVR